MIINTGNRTDIVAFYMPWFINRIKEGYVMVRSPYNPQHIYRYILNSDVVDCIVFCTKNPAPMLDYLHELKDFRLLVYVTITPYNTTIEPYVPNKNRIIDAFIELSKRIGSKQVIWRYDPIFFDDYYTFDYHVRIFKQMCQKLHGYTHICVISFIDLFEKVKRNFPNVQEVPETIQEMICLRFVEIARQYDIDIYLCLENEKLKKTGVYTQGCMSQSVIENALDIRLNHHHTPARQGCNCLLNNDIGAYNTCLHGCLYCYANINRKAVEDNYKKHNVHSPLLIGDIKKDDIIKDMMQSSSIDSQLYLDL